MAHLVPKDLVELPFVDRVPNPLERPDQRRIEWIRNGDCLGAAEHAADNSGELNRGPVQVQKNAVTLMENEKVISDSLKEIIERVNSHDDALGSIGDDNLATKLEELEEQVAPLDDKITQNSQNLFLVGEAVTNIVSRLGTKPLLDIHDRNLFEDVFWVKKEIGNWAGKDVNDNDSPLTTDPTGLKARIVAQGLGISSNERRIVKLESDWIQSDVGALTSEIQDIRGELGRVSDAPATTVYRWIKDSNLKHDQYEQDLENLKNAVGGGGTGDTLDERITANTTKIEEHTLDIAGNTNQIVNIVAQIGDATTQDTMKYKISQSELKISELQGIVGLSEDQGLQKGVQDIRTEIGTDTLAGSIKNRITSTESNLLDTQREVASLTTKVGVNTAGSETGIYKRLVTMETNLNEPTTGLNDVVDTLKTSKVDEAPKDNNIYGRKDGAWERIAGGGAGGIQDAPNDGKEYVRKSENWFELNSQGIVIPEGQKLEIMKGSDKVSLIGVFADNLVVGAASSEITLSGKVKSFKSDSTFAITSSDATNANVISSSAGEVKIGDISTLTVLPTSNAKPVSVEMAGRKYDVLHEGNIEAYENKVYGGYSVEENSTETAVSQTPSAVKFGVDTKTNLHFNTANIVVSEGKLQFDTNTIGKVLNVVAEFRVTSQTAAKILFEIVNASNHVIASETIETDEWSVGKSAKIRMQGLSQLDIADDEIFVRVSNPTGTSSVIVKDGRFYVNSI